MAAGAVTPAFHSHPLNPPSGSEHREGANAREPRPLALGVSGPLALETHGRAAERRDQQTEDVGCHHDEQRTSVIRLSIQEGREHHAGAVRHRADEHTETEHFEPVRPPASAAHARAGGPHSEEDGEAQDRRPHEPIGVDAGEDVRHEGHGTGSHEREEGGQTVSDRKRLLLRELLRLAYPFVRTYPQVVPDAHRQTVGQQVGHSKHEHRDGRQRASRHAGDDGKRRDDAVIGAVHEIANVVLRDSHCGVRLDVQRDSMKGRARQAWHQI